MLTDRKNRLQGMKLCAVWTKNRTRQYEFVSVRQSGRSNAVWASFRTIGVNTHGATLSNTRNGPTI